MLKKSFSLLSLSLALISSTLLPQTSFATSNFNQGEQYEQGAYQNSSQPLAVNWSHHSHIYGSDSGDIQWKLAVSKTNLQAPVVSADGTIYASDERNFKAINPDGSIKWEYPSFVYGSSIASDGTIYATAGNYLIALNPDGSKKWEFNSPYAHFGGTPAIGADGTIYAIAGDQRNGVYAINSDGSLKWKTQLIGSVGYPGGVLIDKNGKIYVVNKDGYVYAFNDSGEMLWKSASYKGSNLISGAYGISPRGDIYVVTSKYLNILNNEDGSLLYQINISSYDLGRVTAPAFDTNDGTFYIGVQTSINQNKLIAFNSDGTKKWEYQGKGYIMATPIIDAEGTIYLGINHDGFYALNKNGTVKWNQSFINPTFATLGSSYSFSPEGVIYGYVSEYMNGKFNPSLFAIGTPKEQSKQVENLWTKPTTMEPLPSGWTDDNRQRVEAGSYKITFKAKSDSGKSLLNLYASSRSTLDINIPTTTEYQEYSYEFTTINNEIFLYGRYGVADISVKDIVLEKVE